MVSATSNQETEAHRWVRYHVTAFFILIGVSIGLIIVDAKVAEIIGPKQMSGFRAILFVSVLLAGVGARALLAWRSGTVDLQGRILLAVIGLVLLTGSAFGLSDCLQEVREHIKNAQPPELAASQKLPPKRAAWNLKAKHAEPHDRPGAAKTP